MKGGRRPCRESGAPLSHSVRQAIEAIGDATSEAITTSERDMFPQDAAALLDVLKPLRAIRNTVDTLLEADGQ